jgi:hypothetical protein
MRTMYARAARRAAAGAVLACAALLMTACSSPSSSSAAKLTSSATAARTGTKVYLAKSQDIRETPFYKPACRSAWSCQMSGDGTAYLYNMTWQTWSGTKAVGTGIYGINGCNPDCATGHIYKVPAVVTLSNPVKACSSAGTRWFWSRASFKFPKGLPKALQGENLSSWTFTGVINDARYSCRGQDTPRQR